MIERLGITWTVGAKSGWGTYGLNLAVQCALKGIKPALLAIATDPAMTPAQGAALQPALAEYSQWYELYRRGTAEFEFPLLHALGDKLDFPGTTAGLKGRPDIGVVFFESAIIPPANLAAADRFSLIVTGSSWNTQVLERHGFKRAVYCPQGVDLQLFTPGLRQGNFAGRFAIFSGGKLEYRKGQDLVVAAFKRLHQRHPDALLVTAWHSPWPKIAETIALSPHVNSAPGVDGSGQLDIGGWLVANGIPETAFVEVGSLPNTVVPSLLREVDLAVFPNRSEGGTNLVAMECMAMGVPVVLSRNTGHLDLISGDNCYTLDMQIPIGEITKRADLTDWGESSIDELVQRMEQAYTDRADAQARGVAGRTFMQRWDWSTQVDRFLAAIAPVV
jgi:glycosyltransferase involved in cell wall biosynthesis